MKEKSVGSMMRGLQENSKALLVLFTLALAMRLACVLFLQQTPLAADDLQYDNIAVNILQGEGFSYDAVKPTAARGPLYPLFLAAAYSVFGHDYNAVRLLQALIGALTCILIYLIAKKLYNPSIAFCAFLIAAVYPSLIGYSGLLYSETLAAFLAAAAISLYLFSAGKKSVTMFILTGVLCGLLALCYPKFLFLPVILGLSIYFFSKIRKGFVKYFIALMAGVILSLAPWTIRNYRTFGRVIPAATGAGTALWYSTLPEDYKGWHFDKEPLLSEFKKIYPGPMDEYRQQEFLFSVETNGIFAKKALSNIKDNPLLFFKLCVKRLFRQWFASNSNSFYALRADTGSYFLNRDYGVFSVKVLLLLLQVCVVGLGCLGLSIDFASNAMNVFSPVSLTVIYSTVISSIFITQARYQIPVLGLLSVYTAIGAGWVLLRLARR